MEGKGESNKYHYCEVIYELGFSSDLIAPGLHCDHQGLILRSKFHKNAAADQVLPHHYPCSMPPALWLS